MKRIVFLALMLAAVASFGQKQSKPNINKALTLMNEGKLQEAKDIIDAATTFEKTMNDGKTWYYRGLIYSAIDTTSNAAVKALDPDAFKVAMESFAKADQLAKGNTEYFITSSTSVVPVMKSQQMEMLANYHLDKGIKKFQDEQDNEGSLVSLKKTTDIMENQMKDKRYGNDTLTYYVTGLVAQQAEKEDQAIEAINKYLDKGGKSKDAFLILYQIYNAGPKEDKNKALQVVQQAKVKVPSNPDFPKLEIGLLIDMGKVADAKAGLEEAVKKEPGNKVLQFYLGYVNMKMENMEEARKGFEEALKLDPNYFDAAFYLSNTYLVEVDKISKELSSTGNTPKDSKKRSELVQQRVKASETALPYLERVEKMKAPEKDSEVEVLQKLALIYYYIADDKNSQRVDKKLKALGVSDN